MPVPPEAYMPPEELSKIIEDEELFLPLSKGIWLKLIGKLITCPVCSRKAVIVPFGMEIPVENPYDAPCHCSISLATGDIVCCWCVNDEHYNKRSHCHLYYYNMFYDKESTDVCSAIEIFMRTSHKI